MHQYSGEPAHTKTGITPKLSFVTQQNTKGKMSKKQKRDPKTLMMTALANHFGKISPSELITATRQFPITARVDLQRAVDHIFAEKFEAKAFGAHRSYGFSALSFSDCMTDGSDPVLIGPLQYDEVDIGDEHPARCMKQVVWTCRDGKTLFSVILAMPERHSEDGISLTIAVPPGEAGLALSRKFLHELEQLVNRNSSFRGKVISLEKASRYSGKSGSVRVHKLRQVVREDVILPSKTLQLLERNVTEFIKFRAKLRELGMPVKKGLLFYGPPGTGKTHTIHYLASQLPDHTTLLITASQVGLLEEYCALARFLQPAMLVIEDADLIARNRDDMNSPCEESLLNQLLNEMDGLREDAEILFVLTTNRPEQLETALSSRPGRIDQSIEFPLPDEEGRRKLVKLYGRGLSIKEKLSDLIVKKTEHASPAFIKELMRRSAQHVLQAGGKDVLQEEHVTLALEDMLFSGGSLNLKLLGGAMTAAGTE